MRRGAGTGLACHHPGDYRELEQSTHRGDAPVQRRRRSAPPLGQPDYRRTCSALGLGLPVQIVEQVARPHLGQTNALPGEETQEVQHVIGVRAPRRPGEVPALQMSQKPVHHRDVVALPAATSPARRKTSPSLITRSPIGTSEPEATDL